MKNCDCTNSSDDDWTVVTDQTSPTRRSDTPSDIIDQTSVDKGKNNSVVTDESVSKLSDENRQLTEEWHRLRIENQWMAKEIKGARYLLSKMLESLGLEHNKQVFATVMSSSTKEDFSCFQNLTKKLLSAVESGMVQNVKDIWPKNIKKREHRNVPKQMDEPKFNPRCGKQSALMFKSIREEPDLIDWDKNAMITVSRAKLPRIEEIVTMQQKVTRRKNFPTINFKSAMLDHAQCISNKKRSSLDCGATRQAFAVRRKC